MNAAQKTVFYDVSTGETKIIRNTLSVENEADLAVHVESNVIGLYPDYTFQTMEGFGCALTESSCYLLSKLSREERRKTLSLWFSKEGMNASFVRMHIDSCDYSLEEYQAVKDPIADPELLTFSIDHDRKYVIPVVKEAMALSSHPLQVLLSPWSPPYQWKTPPELSENDAAVYGGMGMKVETDKPIRDFGGRLKPEYYAPYARYLVKYLQAYLKEGIPVSMLSIQNEASAATNWDSCLWTGEQERTFLVDYLYPEMERSGLSGRVQIFIWDHNKERAIEHIDAFMKDERAAKEVDGFALHWYSGDHFEALSLLHQKYPDKILMHSESCGLHIPGKTTAFVLTKEQEALLAGKKMELEAAGEQKTPNQCDFEDALHYAHDILGDLNHGLQRWIDWNLIVDRNGGPRHVPGGFAAPLVYENDGTITQTVSFAFLHTIAEAVQPGAVRLGSSSYGREAEAAAVRNPDGSLSVLILNESAKDIRVNLRLQGQILRDAAIPAGSLSAIRIA